MFRCFAEFDQFSPAVVVVPPAAGGGAESLLKTPLFKPPSTTAILARMEPDTFQPSHWAGKRVTRWR